MTKGLVVWAVVALMLAGAVLGIAATNATTGNGGGIPDLCAMSVDSLRMRTHGIGYTLSQAQEPSEVTSNEAGQCVAIFDRRMHSAATQFDLYWDGELQMEVPGWKRCEDLPRGEKDECIMGTGLIYQLEATIGADGSITVRLPLPAYQWWWCGEKIGECRVGESDAFFSQECIAASHDPEYLKLYQPGSGPACTMGTYYKECNGCPVVKVED